MVPALDKATHSLYVLREMIKTFPEPIQTAMNAQLDNFIDSLAEANVSFCSNLIEDIAEAQVRVAAMHFDLESTKNERDHYKNKLGE